MKRTTLLKLLRREGCTLLRAGHIAVFGGKGIVESDKAEQLTTDEKRAALFIGSELGTVSRPDLVEAGREVADAGFDVLIACAFNYDTHASEFNKLGRVPILKARMNADLKNTGTATCSSSSASRTLQWSVASGW